MVFATYPLDFAAAVTASREASEDQHNAEKWYAAKGREFAEAERQYRKALATKILMLKVQGTPATVAQDIARGDEEVANLRFERDVAEGVRDAAAQSIYRHTANRRELLQFVDWSKRASFLDREPPQDMPTFGGRR